MRTRAEVLALDAADPLAGFRERFVVRDTHERYVDGNSLGRQPVATAAAVSALLGAWGERLIGGWEDWIGEPTRLGDALGGPLLGARPGETLVCDSVTVNLHKLARAALADADPGRPVVAWRADFPTDRDVVGSLGRPIVWRDGTPEPDDLADVEAALVVCSLVHYRSGARADLAAVTAAAHAAGARILWDVSHAVGAIAIDLPGAGADLAVGCTYKYLNGGPGAPGFLWVREDLVEQLVSPLPGWFGRAEQFAMERPYAPAPGIARFLAGTPPILALAALEPGFAPLAEAGMAAVEAKGAALTGLAVELADAWLAPLGFTVATPRDSAARGGHVALAHPEAWAVCRGLIERAAVIPDFRPPDVVRFGFPALSTSFADVGAPRPPPRPRGAPGAPRVGDAAPRRVT